MASNAELFLEHLEGMFGEEDAIHQADAADGGTPINVFVYKNIPEEGMITGVTYGLSLCEWPEWKFARPEMIVSVESLELDWPCAAAAFVGLFRGEKTFQYGDIFTTDVPLAHDTKMDGFLVFAPSILEEGWDSVQLNDYKVHLSQFYPIHRQELATYERIGLKAFWHHPGFDAYDIKRKPIES